MLHAACMDLEDGCAFWGESKDKIKSLFLDTVSSFQQFLCHPLDHNTRYSAFFHILTYWSEKSITLVLGRQGIWEHVVSFIWPVGINGKCKPCSARSWSAKWLHIQKLYFFSILTCFNKKMSCLSTTFACFIFLEHQKYNFCFYIFGVFISRKQTMVYLPTFPSSPRTHIFLWSMILDIESSQYVK